MKPDSPEFKEHIAAYLRDHYTDKMLNALVTWITKKGPVSLPAAHCEGIHDHLEAQMIPYDVLVPLVEAEVTRRATVN